MHDIEYTGNISFIFNNQDYFFNELPLLREKGWNICVDAPSIHFSSKFTGTISDLKVKILEDLFEKAVAYDSATVNALCTVFEDICVRCESIKMPQSFNVPFKKDSISVDFNLDLADEKEKLKAQIAETAIQLKYTAEALNKYQVAYEDTRKKYQSLKDRLKNLEKD